MRQERRGRENLVAGRAGRRRSEELDGCDLLGECRVPDDCIDPRRLPLFAGRAFFRDLIITIETRQSGESQL